MRRRRGGGGGGGGAYVRARQLFTADADDPTKMNARDLQVWGSAWRPSVAGAPLQSMSICMFFLCPFSSSCRGGVAA